MNLVTESNKLVTNDKSMVVDTVKPEAKTKREWEKRRENRWQSELATLSYTKRRKIEVKHV